MSPAKGGRLVAVEVRAGSGVEVKAAEGPGTACAVSASNVDATTVSTVDESNDSAVAWPAQAWKRMEIIRIAFFTALPAFHGMIGNQVEAPSVVLYKER